MASEALTAAAPVIGDAIKAQQQTNQQIVKTVGDFATNIFNQKAETKREKIRQGAMTVRENARQSANISDSSGKTQAELASVQTQNLTSGNLGGSTSGRTNATGGSTADQFSAATEGLLTIGEPFAQEIQSLSGLLSSGETTTILGDEQTGASAIVRNLALIAVG